MLSTHPVPLGWAGLLVALASALALASGCGPADNLSTRLDEDSRRRLEAADTAARVVVACRIEPVPAALPPLGGGETVLTRTENSLLIEIAAGSVGRLGKLDGIGRVAVWGEREVADRIGPILRRRLLEAWAEDEPPALSLIASFEAGDDERLRRGIEEQGGVPRTVAGGVATLDATPEAALRILEMPGLRRLEAPRRLHPTNQG